MMKEEYEVIIVGGGVVGTALAYVLSKYTTVKDILLLEKYKQLGQVNSARNNNSQTLHFGDIETNYTLDKAKKVNVAASLLKQYLDTHGEKLEKQQLYVKTPKMVLGVGEKQVELLKSRFRDFKTIFPTLRLIEREEIGRIEPLVVKGREEKEPIIALYSEDGYGVNYDVLAQSFVEDVKKTKKVHVCLGEEVVAVTMLQESIHGYYISTTKNKYRARVVVFCSGSHSLIFAKKLGYGLEFGLLPVAGNFFGTKRKLLNGKVYTIQKEKLPFAAIHGDPYVDNLHETRFGPTAKVLPMLERHRYGTVPDFLKTSVFKIRGVLSLLNILFDRVIFLYMLQNFYYDIPVLGKRSFITEVRKIVPSIRLDELEFRKGYGGIRPQLVNWKKMALEMGDAKIEGENIIFNITPSPGASVCLENARIDALKVIGFLRDNFEEKIVFDEKKFEKELGRID